MNENNRSTSKADAGRTGEIDPMGAFVGGRWKLVVVLAKLIG